jgi:myo-inositol-1(or 4)-monophosphatase
MIKTPLMNVMTAAALKAGKSLKRNAGKISAKDLARKGPGDFVTEMDKRTEKILFEELSVARPGYGFVMEEGGSVEGSDKTHRWHIDPIDGTTNFVQGIPIFSISVALERDGQLVAGLVYNPAMEELYTAEKGQGAFLSSPDGNQRLRVGQKTALTDCCIGCGIPPLAKGAQHGRFLRDLAAVMSAVGGVRRFASAALDLAYVASGRLDGFWERGLSSWDIAAGIVLVREAGGFASDLAGGDGFLESGDILVGGQAVHAGLLEVLRTSA